MNIFVIEKHPADCARSMCDRHVVKMILETAQLLSTAHRVLDGLEVIDDTGRRKIKRWILANDEMEIALPKATHINHPCAVWTRESISNYWWLNAHFSALLKEYTHRYNKLHKYQILKEYLKEFPKNITTGEMTPFVLAMPDQYKNDDAIESYRNYYVQGKSHLFSWKNRNPPEWIPKELIPKEELV